MPKTKNSKRIVVDASVARSAGGKESNDSTSMHCREMLQAIRTICHQVVMTEAIAGEWKKHQSRFTMTWRTQMAARKKLLYSKVEESETLRAKITSGIAATAREVVLRDFDPGSAIQRKLSPAERAYEAILKDLPLLEAAMTADRIVISLDIVSQYLFAATCQQVGEIGDVMWVHPDEADILEWLQEGANVQREWQLRYYRPNKQE
jgi:hypothetical protein